MIKRVHLTPDYSISQIIKGGWQLAGGHGPINNHRAIKDMFEYYDAGVTTFDCADIYTGVESLIGQFLKELKTERGAQELEKVQVHTKYVPNRARLGKLKKKDVESAIYRSCKRLGVKRLDLVQFHWWDFEVDQYVEVGMFLEELRQKGLIRNLGLTNFDACHIERLTKAGVTILTNQVQYSALDHRPEKTLQSYSKAKHMYLICYGGLAGGFISNKYLAQPEPTTAKLRKNRSLVKYKLIIDDLGGWSMFQNILKKLQLIGVQHDLTVSETALLYVLSKPQVSAVSVGARDDRHLDSLKSLHGKKLSKREIKEIDNVVGRGHALFGDIYDLERSNARHAGIMKYNLNSEV